MEEDEAKRLWVVDATSFVASGGVVVGPGKQPAATAAAVAGADVSASASASAMTAAAAADPDGAAAASVSEAAAVSSRGAVSGTSPASRRPALALPPQAMCVLDLLARALVGSNEPPMSTRLADIITMDLPLLELLLQLGMPAAYEHMPQGDDNQYGPLGWAIKVYGSGHTIDADRDAALIKVRVGVAA